MSELPSSPGSAPVLILSVTCSRCLFTLGQVVATPGALDLLDRTGINSSVLLARHARGDWGIVCEEDAAVNAQALQDGGRLLSAYEIGPGCERLWIITEHDRSVTTLLLPEEY